MAKSHLKLAAPTENLRTVAPGRRPKAEFLTREHLTLGEVETLIEAAKANRHGHRGCDHDPNRLPARPAGVRALRPALGPGRVRHMLRRRPSEKKGVLGLTSRLATAGVAAAGQRRPQKSAERSFEAAQCSHKSFRFACLGGR
jgi:hypothetical protein